MAYTAWSVVFGEQPTAAKWNQLGANDAGFKDGTNIDSLAITTANLAAASVTPDKLSLGGQNNFVFTDQSTSSTSFTDLATVQSLTVTVGANGLLLVMWSAGLYNVAGQKYCGVALSGANTVAAGDNESIRNDAATFSGTQSRARLFTGLTPGSTTVTLKFRTASGTANFFTRNLTVIPL